MFSLIKSIFISLKENRGISLKISNAKIKVKAYLIKLYSYRKVKTVCFNKFSSCFEMQSKGKKEQKRSKFLSNNVSILLLFQSFIKNSICHFRSLKELVPRICQPLIHQDARGEDEEEELI